MLMPWNDWHHHRNQLCNSNQAGFRWASGSFSFASSAAGPWTSMRISWPIASACASIRAHVLQVRQQRFGVDVAFAAEYFVAVDGELIEKITRFVLRLGRKLRQDRLKIRHLIRGHLEVGMETDESRKPIHTLIVNLSGMRSETRRALMPAAS